MFYFKNEISGKTNEEKSVMITQLLKRSSFHFISRMSRNLKEYISILKYLKSFFIIFFTESTFIHLFFVHYSFTDK